MFFREMKRDLDYTRQELRDLKEKYWELERRHSMLLWHLGLTERKVLEHTKLEPVKPASA